MSVHSHINNGWFYTTKEELSSRDGVHRAQFTDMDNSVVMAAGVQGGVAVEEDIEGINGDEKIKLAQPVLLIGLASTQQVTG